MKSGKGILSNDVTFKYDLTPNAPFWAQKGVKIRIF